jgi:hypothetical protein
MASTIAYIAEQKLYIQQNGATAQLHESTWVQELLDRAERSRERNNWKSDGLAWNIRSGAMPGLMRGAPAEVRHVAFASIARGRCANELYYSINTDHVGGIFQLEMPGNYERRLVHRNELCAIDLASHPTEPLLAVSLRNGDGTAHIGTMEVDHRGLRVVTEGDVIDEAPVWASKPQTLIYQSAGIARDQNGFVRALGAYSLNELDLASNSHRVLLQNSAFDFLLPRIDRAGRLLYICRPYQGLPVASPLTVLQDVLLFPYRVVRTMVHVLHFLSLVFSGKPLISAGGPQQLGPSPTELMLWGRVIKAQQAMRRGSAAANALVPRDWRLVARHDNGEETTLAHHVVCYDLAPDGTIIYSDGSRIFSLDGTGEPTCIGQGTLIHKLAVIA